MLVISAARRRAHAGLQPALTRLVNISQTMSHIRSCRVGVTLQSPYGGAALRNRAIVHYRNVVLNIFICVQAAVASTNAGGQIGGILLPSLTTLQARSDLHF
jgi:hypothetical protein